MNWLNREDRYQFAIAITGGVALLVSTLLIGVLFFSAVMARVAQGQDHYIGHHYAQVDPKIRQWFQDQKSPQGHPCCSIADGTFAEEDIRDGKYWVRFVAQTRDGERAVDWMQVPDSAVILAPNFHGRPAVWYFWNEDDQSWSVRCFIAGAKI